MRGIRPRATAHAPCTVVRALLVSSEDVDVPIDRPDHETVTDRLSPYRVTPTPSDRRSHRTRGRQTKALRPTEWRMTVCQLSDPGVVNGRLGNADAPRHAPRKISSHEPHPAYSPNKKDHNDCVRYCKLQGRGWRGHGRSWDRTRSSRAAPLHRFLSTVPHSHHSDWEGKCVPSQLSSRARRLD